LRQKVLKGEPALRKKQLLQSDQQKRKGNLGVST